MLKKDKDKIKEAIEDIEVNYGEEIGYIPADDIDKTVEKIADYLDSRGYKIEEEKENILEKYMNALWEVRYEPDKMFLIIDKFRQETKRGNKK